MTSRTFSLCGCLALSAILGLPTLSFAQSIADQPAPRTWTDHAGLHETEATFVRASESSVILKTPEGKILTVALKLLSKADQDYVRQRATGSGGVMAGSSDTDWPCWRGPKHDGVARADGARFEWGTQAPNELWSKDIGRGYASFAVAGGRVFTMGYQDGNEVVWCLDARDGAVIWSHKYPAKSQSDSFPGPRSTPAVVGGCVYTFGSESDTFCLDASDGKVIWSRKLEDDIKSQRPGWWYASSPVIVDDLILINIGSSGVALDKKTGKTEWERGSDKCGYASIVPSPDKSKIAVFSAKKIYLSDLSNGRVKWGTTWETAHDVNAADPVFIDDKIFITSGYGHGCALLNVSTGRIEWETKAMRSQTIAPVVHDGFIYGADGSVGSARLVCVDPKDGSVRWKGDLKIGGLFLAGDKLLVQGASGTVSVVEASPDDYKLLAETEVLDGTCWTTPVLAQGLLFCRNKEGKMVALDCSAR